MTEKNKFFMWISAMIIVLIICSTSPITAHAKVVKKPTGFYPHMAQVTKVKKVKGKPYKEIFAVDAEGRPWSWYDDSETWCKGDFAAFIMYDNHTRKVWDDQIIDAKYVGYKKQFK